MIKGKLVILNEIVFFLSLIFMFINHIEILDYITYGIGTITLILSLFTKKIKNKMYDNKKTGYPRNSHKNVLFNVFMTEKEKELKLKTDWILNIEQIKKRYNVKEKN